jgi:hypothetical protein
MIELIVLLQPTIAATTKHKPSLLSEKRRVLSEKRRGEPVVGPFIGVEEILSQEA